MANKEYCFTIIDKSQNISESKHSSGFYDTEKSPSSVALREAYQYHIGRNDDYNMIRNCVYLVLIFDTALNILGTFKVRVDIRTSSHLNSIKIDTVFTVGPGGGEES